MVLLLLVAGWWGLAANASAAQAQPPEPRREVQGDPAAPAISFITSPGATCLRPQPKSDACYITWSYLSVTAAPSQYIISMTVAIDNQVRAVHWGFFQQSLFFPAELYGEGLRISCGPPGAAGLPGLGRAYSYVVRARETGGLQAANYGAVTCPAGLYTTYLPVLLR